MTQDPTASTPRRTLSLKRDGAPQLEERLHKVLAQAGLGSRRALEERIAQGQISVNGAVASVGSSIASGDKVELDGKTFVAAIESESPRVLLYNKPEGEVTTRDDPEGRPTVFDRLPPIKGARWINVGRLDINTTGLLLLTTDGDLTHALTHPSTEVTREYICRIHGEPNDADVARLEQGVTLEDGPAKFDEIERIGASDSHAWFRVVLSEGRNREVRRLWETIGFQVSRLKRVRYGSVALPRLLKRGQFQELSPQDVERLRDELKLNQAAAVLTLQPVIRQRRGKAAEIRPAPREQRAWTQSSNSDESRELRAFDRLREEPSRDSPYGKGRAKRSNGRPVPDDIGNRLTAPGGSKPGKPQRRKTAAPGFENQAAHRAWYVPEGVTTTSRIAPPRQVGRPGRSTDAPGAKRDRPNAQPGAFPGKPRSTDPGGAKRGRPGAQPGAASGKPGGQGPQGPKGRGKPASRGGRPGHGAPRSNKPRG